MSSAKAKVLLLGISLVTGGVIAAGRVAMLQREEPTVVPPHQSPMAKRAYRRMFAIRYAGKERIGKPSAICLGRRQDVYLADSVTCRIHRFTRDGRYLGSFGTLGQRAMEFDSPSALAVDSAGRMYVADQGNNRIVQLGPDGIVKAVIRENVVAPASVSVGKDDVLYMSSETARIGGIRAFGPTPKPVSLFGPPHFEGFVACSPDGVCFALETSGCRNTVTRYRNVRPELRFAGSTGPFGDPRLLYLPRGLAVDTERVCVNRFGDGSVSIYDRDGAYIQSLPRSALAVGSVTELISPSAIAVDTDGTFYICVQGNNSFQRFDHVRM